jgi:murein L,D-transpeptidase YcbB/YkuD
MPPVRDCAPMMETAKIPGESVDGKMVRPCIRPFEKGKWDADRIDQLKQVLIKESVNDSTTEKDGTISDLKEEVMRLQKKFGIPQTGFVGDMTAKKLNDSIFKYDLKPMKGN